MHAQRVLDAERERGREREREGGILSAKPNITTPMGHATVYPAYLPKKVRRPATKAIRKSLRTAKRGNRMPHTRRGEQRRGRSNEVRRVRVNQALASSRYRGESICARATPLLYLDV